MREQFIDSALDLSLAKGDFFSGNRKIIRDQKVVFTSLENDFGITDCGFTKNKLTALRRGYFVEDSVQAAVSLWNRCLTRRKYASAGMHCYNHLLKNNPEKKSIRASVMGPCIQAVTLTWVPRPRGTGVCAVDCFYRTTEYFKKFPADLVFLRDILLPEFDFEECPIETITFHFANVTIHPMYFVTLIPMIPRPISFLKELKRTDPHFWDWIIKWTSRYICEEYYHGIAKFEQAKRVQMDAQRRIKPELMVKLQKYVRDNHSGFRGNKRNVFA